MFVNGYEIKAGVTLFDANLSGADLSGANLSRADLFGANLSGANLFRADLSHANLSGADLSGADLSDANLSRADLSHANLSGADLSGADLSDANLCQISGIITVGYPNGYMAFGWAKEGTLVIRVDCSTQNAEEALSYWENKPNRREVLEAVRYIISVAKIRGWKV